MSYENVCSWRRRCKLALIAYKGGKCQRCGYDKIEYPRVFDFHHRESEQKDFSLSSKNWSIDRLKAEVDKCDLLCRNCHSEVHEELDGQRRQVRVETKKKARPTLICEGCSNEFKRMREDQRYCCLACSDIGRRKIERPSREELEKLIWEKPTSTIAFELNVSDVAISKWCKHYGIQKPSRGHWSKVKFGAIS